MLRSALAWAFRPATCLSVLLSLATPARAKIQAVIVQWGETEIDRAGRLDPQFQGTLLGPGFTFNARRFINDSTRIPAQLCRSFGFEAWLTRGPDETLPDRVTVSIRHPQLTRPDGVTASGQTMGAAVNHASIGNSYSFDYPWEVRPGEWVFEIILGGEVLASKTFTVVEREPGAPASICTGGPTS